mgnify:CR=1 FL=1
MSALPENLILHERGWLSSNNLLCLVGDEMPTIQPTLADVANTLSRIPTDNCFGR